MLYYKNNEWNISLEKIRYIQDDIETEKYIEQEGKEWWLDFESKWDNMEILEFIEVTATPEQLKRLSEVNQLNIPGGYISIIGDYVIDSRFPDTLIHPLKDLENRKENELLKQEANILRTQIQSANDVAEFQEDLIVELAMKLY